jgi:hypothetical protein
MKIKNKTQPKTTKRKTKLRRHKSNKLRHGGMLKASASSSRLTFDAMDAVLATTTDPYEAKAIHLAKKIMENSAVEFRFEHGVTYLKATPGPSVKASVVSLVELTKKMHSDAVGCALRGHRPQDASSLCVTSALKHGPAKLLMERMATSDPHKTVVLRKLSSYYQSHQVDHEMAIVLGKIETACAKGMDATTMMFPIGGMAQHVAMMSVRASAGHASPMSPLSDSPVCLTPRMRADSDGNAFLSFRDLCRTLMPFDILVAIAAQVDIAEMTTFHS